MLQNGELPNGRDTQEPHNAGGWGARTKHSPCLYTSLGSYCFILLETGPQARRSWVWVCFRYGGSGVGWGLGTTCEHLVFSCCQGPGTPEQSRKQQQQGRMQGWPGAASRLMLHATPFWWTCMKTRVFILCSIFLITLEPLLCSDVGAFSSSHPCSTLVSYLSL